MLSSLLILFGLLVTCDAVPQSVKTRPELGPAYEIHNNLTVVNNSSSNSTASNKTAHHDVNAGVCFEEVPTASLVHNKQNIPAGNGSRPGYSRIRTCCKGYQRNIHIFHRCDPICTQPCVNAVCTAPETCTCNEDHVNNLAGFCVATCPQACQNGECAGAECLCNPGYKLDANSKFCIPICEKQCSGHGNCTAPERCACEHGYAAHNDGTCLPRCDGCDHGVCVFPGVCQCSKGYAKNERGECAAVCSRGCENGVCIAPDVCTCQYGHELNAVSGRCEPKCLKPCINGACSGPDTCVCNKGYILDPADPTGTKCLPDCPGGCPHGVCSAPNFCICKLGFVKDRSVKGSSSCVPRVKRSLDLRELLIYNIAPEDQ